MNDSSALARTLIMWLVPFAVVAAALGFETNWGRTVVRDAPAPAAPPTARVAVSLLPEYRVDGGLEARKETVDRVLFSPTRRPAPPATQAAGPSTMPKGTYTLTGTTVVGNTATAFLRETKGGKSRSVRQGETLDGMLVAEVRPDRVRLKQGNDFEDLQLKIAAGPKTTIQMAAPVPAAPVAGGSAAAAGAVPQPANAADAASATGRQQVRPAVPGAPTNPAGAGPGGTLSVSEMLAERRRAARQAAEAAAALGRPQSTPR